MSFRRKIQALVKDITGLQVYRNLPFGMDPMNDIKFVFKGRPLKVIFDVGANIGLSANEYRGLHPNSEIHCFEPIEHTYKQLLENTKPLNVKCHNYAMGSQEMETEIKLDLQDRDSVMNSLVEDNQSGRLTEFKTETITVKTLDGFCATEKIPHIDFLKIDTEGFDLEVIKGAQQLLENNNIDLIQAEVSINAYNTYHVSFSEVREYLAQYNYAVFGFYHQVREWKTPQQVLRICDVLFISEKLANSRA